MTFTFYTDITVTSRYILFLESKDNHVIKWIMHGSECNEGKGTVLSYKVSSSETKFTNIYQLLRQPHNLENIAFDFLVLLFHFFSIWYKSKGNWSNIGTLFWKRRDNASQQLQEVVEKIFMKLFLCLFFVFVLPLVVSLCSTTLSKASPLNELRAQRTI